MTAAASPFGGTTKLPAISAPALLNSDILLREWLRLSSQCQLEGRHG